MKGTHENYSMRPDEETQDKRERASDGFTLALLTNQYPSNTGRILVHACIDNYTNSAFAPSLGSIERKTEIVKQLKLQIIQLEILQK